MTQLLMNELACTATDPTRRTYFRMIGVADAAFLISLRTNAELSRYLSAVDPAVEKQAAWLAQYKLKEAERREFYFVIMHDAKPIGVVRMYNFEGSPGEAAGLGLLDIETVLDGDKRLAETGGTDIASSAAVRG